MGKVHHSDNFGKFWELINHGLVLGGSGISVFVVTSDPEARLRVGHRVKDDILYIIYSPTMPLEEKDANNLQKPEDDVDLLLYHEHRAGRLVIDPE